MRRSKAEQIGVLIRNYLRQESLESPLNERRLINAWPEVLGPVIASYTQGLFIKNQVLYVHLNSATLRQEFMMGRELLVRSGHYPYYFSLTQLINHFIHAYIKVFCWHTFQ